jgi:hypothetical protein
MRPGTRAERPFAGARWTTMGIALLRKMDRGN